MGMIIQITCTGKEYRELFSNFKIDKITVVEEKTRKSQRTLRRLEFIRGNIEGEIKKEALYTKIRKEGFPYTRKTLQRDLRELEKEGKCIVEVIPGGKHGSYTIVRKPKGEQN